MSSSDFSNRRGKGFMKRVTGKTIPYSKDAYLQRLVSENDFSRCETCSRLTVHVEGKCRGCNPNLVSKNEVY